QNEQVVRFQTETLPASGSSRTRSPGGRSPSEFRHRSRPHVLDEPSAIDAYQGIVRIRVCGDLVCGLIDVETFEVEVGVVALDGILDTERGRIGDPLILRLERPGRLPITSELILSGVGFPAGGKCRVVREK